MNTEFRELRTYFDKLDLDNVKSGIYGWRDTKDGIWGHSNFEKVFELFKRLPLKESDVFLDLGHGDGRIVFLASLFCKAVGVESDGLMFDESLKHREALSSDVELVNDDLMNLDFSKFTVFFTFWDKRFSKEFEEKLSKINGVLVNYSEIFKPERLELDNKLWLDQTPALIYKLPQELKPLPGDGLKLNIS